MGFNIRAPYMDCVTHKQISPSVIYLIKIVKYKEEDTQVYKIGI